jgi:N-acetylglutamate synthase/N-acetylornithine aminotransferase
VDTGASAVVTNSSLANCATGVEISENAQLEMKDSQVSYLWDLFLLYSMYSIKISEKRMLS